MNLIQRTSLLVVICFAIVTSCSREAPTVSWSGEVEVAPGKWLRIDGQEGRAWFQCRWNRKTVYWGGDYGKGQVGYFDKQLPVCLRSWKGKLYLIYKQHDLTKGLTNFVYCTLNSKGTEFEEIERQEFPRRIATQNIGMEHEGTAVDENHKEIDNLRILRSLEVSNRHFHNSTTGWIWYHLETGLAPEELNPTMDEALVFYAEFVKKYHPLALRELTR